MDGFNFDVGFSDEVDIIDGVLGLGHSHTVTPPESPPMSQSESPRSTGGKRKKRKLEPTGKVEIPYADVDIASIADQKLRRMMRNRQSAALSRQKKRDTVERLQKMVDNLQSELRSKEERLKKLETDHEKQRVENSRLLSENIALKEEVGKLTTTSAVPGFPVFPTESHSTSPSFDILSESDTEKIDELLWDEVVGDLCSSNWSDDNVVDDLTPDPSCIVNSACADMNAPSVVPASPHSVASSPVVSTSTPPSDTLLFPSDSISNSDDLSPQYSLYSSPGSSSVSVADSPSSSPWSSSSSISSTVSSPAQSSSLSPEIFSASEILSAPSDVPPRTFSFDLFDQVHYELVTNSESKVLKLKPVAGALGHGGINNRLHDTGSRDDSTAEISCGVFSEETLVDGVTVIPPNNNGIAVPPPFVSELPIESAQPLINNFSLQPEKLGFVSSCSILMMVGVVGRWLGRGRLKNAEGDSVLS